VSKRNAGTRDSTITSFVDAMDFNLLVLGKREQFNNPTYHPSVIYFFTLIPLVALLALFFEVLSNYAG
jgi:hypothetical protein